jgi:hypothetical protein
VSSRRAVELIQAAYMRYVLALVVCCFAFTAAHASSGEVCKRISGCDYFVVSTPRGYALLEWYGGTDPDTGDRIRGFETYGMHSIMINDDDEDDMTQVWVEDYFLTRSDALEQLVDKCE